MTDAQGHEQAHDCQPSRPLTSPPGTLVPWAASRSLQGCTQGCGLRGALGQDKSDHGKEKVA